MPQSPYAANHTQRARAERAEALSPNIWDARLTRLGDTRLLNCPSHLTRKDTHPSASMLAFLSPVAKLWPQVLCTRMTQCLPGLDAARLPGAERAR